MTKNIDAKTKDLIKKTLADPVVKSMMERLKQKDGESKVSDHKGLPVAGYTTQTSEAVQMVNLNKKAEERILRDIDLYGMNPDVDKRWLAIAKNHIEQGFMAMNRAIFKPQRVKLGDE